MKSKSVFVISLGVVILIYVVGARSHKECGIVSSNDNDNSLPWVVNIYRKLQTGNHEFLCLGTIIARKVILTAAHCFYDDLNQKINGGSYLVTSGQVSKAWPKDTLKIQVREFTKDDVVLSERYSGLQQLYSNNIAIIKLNPDSRFNITDSTKRACVYWDNDFVEPEYLQNDLDLQAVVWKDDQNGNFKILKPKYVPFDVCVATAPGNLQKFLTSDKICTQSQDIHRIPCTGTGLYAFNKPKNRWYLIGIASDIDNDGSKTFITFAKLQLHLNWISNNAFLHLR